ncbi:mycothiol synthase [Leucobacter sp. HY1908]
MSFSSLPAVAQRILAEIEQADGASPVSDQALLAVSQGARRLLLIAPDGSELDGAKLDGAKLDGAAIGVGVIGEGELDLALLPAHQTPEDTGAALRTLLAHAAGSLRSWVHGDREVIARALAAAGFTPARSLYRMALDPDLLPAGAGPALALPTPAGLALRAYGTEPGDDDAWVVTNAAAFASHPEQGRITVEDFARMRQEPWFDSGDLLLLDAGDELAGSTWVKTLRSDGHATGGDEVSCELYAVGVRPEYAGRGLGRLLLDATLARMAEHAPARVTLYVDGDNTAAVRLYETAGFTIDSRSMQWHRPDSGAASARMDA